MQAAGKAIALCKSDVSISQFPKWNTSLQSEYFIPVTPKMDAYIRGLWTYFPKNDQTESGGIEADSYNLLNLYLGIRDPEGVWEVSLFAKNVADESTMLGASAGEVTSGGGLSGFFGNTGYYTTSYTPPREVGVSVRYAFGSR